MRRQVQDRVNEHRAQDLGQDESQGNDRPEDSQLALRRLLHGSQGLVAQAVDADQPIEGGDLGVCAKVAPAVNRRDDLAARRCGRLPSAERRGAVTNRAGPAPGRRSGCCR